MLHSSKYKGPDPTARAKAVSTMKCQGWYGMDASPGQPRLKFP